MARGRKPGIATAKPSKAEKTQSRLAKAVENKNAEKPVVAAVARTERYAQPPDYTPTVEEISDSLRHIHSTLHIFATSMLAFMTRMEGAPVLVKVPEVVPEAPGVTPLGEVKPRRGRPAKVKAEPVPVEVTEAAAEVVAAAPVFPETETNSFITGPAKVEAVPEKPKTVTFEEMRGAAVALAGKENGRARLTAILQAEAGVANLSGVPEEKRAAVVKALTEAANG
jgi:hypothetical protein